MPFEIIKMEKFEKLSYTSDCDVPPIISLLQSIKENPNSSFFKLGTSIHYATSLNPIYTLVSLRNIIEASPLSLSTAYNDVDWIPTSSYKWLFLIVSIASRKIIENDQELEDGKIRYVFRAFSNFIEKTDLSNTWSVPLVSGAICSFLRMIDETGITPTPKSPNSENSNNNENNFEFFDLKILRQLLENSQNTSKSNKLFRWPSGSQSTRIQLTDFPERDILLFSFPYSSSNSLFNQSNVFADQISIFQISLLKLISRLISADLEQTKLKPNILTSDEIDSYRQIVQILSTKAETAEYAKKVLILLFNGNEQESIQYSDNIQYENTSKLILKAYDDSHKFVDSISYNDTITLINQLKKMSQIATEHPTVFKEFLNRHKDDFVIALVAILSTGYHPEFLCLSAKLLTLGEIKLSNPSTALDLFIQTDNKYLKAELELLLLSNKDQLIKPILSSLPYVADYGFRSMPFFDFLKKFLSSNKNENSADIITLLKNLIETLNKCLYDCDHIPQIYSLISQYISINGYYLERSVCSCQFQEKQARTSNVDDLSHFQKFQYDCIISRFRSPMIISSVQLSYRRKRFIISKVPRTVQVFVSDMEISDANQLLSPSIEWRKVCDLKFTNDQTSSKVDLKLELYATMIKYQFTSFYEENDISKINCPRCHERVTPSNAGICPACGENVFECMRCHVVNFNHIDGFICNECGNSNYAQLECDITAKPHFSNTIIKNDSECSDALAKCDKLIADSQRLLSSLNNIQKQIENVLSPLNSDDDKVNFLSNLYKEDAYSNFQSFTEKMEHLYAIKAAINSFRGNSNEQKWVRRHQHCYNCRQIFVKNCINFLSENSKKFAEAGHEISILDVLIQLLKNEMFIDTVIKALVSYAKINPDSIGDIIDKLVISSLPNILPSSIRLLIEIQSINDVFKYKRLRKILTVIPLFLKCPNTPSSTNILKPLLVSTFTSNLLTQLNSSPEKLMIIKGLSSLTNNAISCHKANPNEEQKEKKNNEEEENNEDVFNDLSNLKVVLSSLMDFVSDIGQFLKNKDVVNYYLIESNSNTVRSTFSEFLTSASTINDAFYDQVFQFALSKVIQTNDSEIFFCSNYEQLFSVFYELLKVKPKKSATILLNNFEFFEKLCESFTQGIASKKTSMFTIVPVLRSSTRLLKLAEIINFILNAPENFYFVIHRKTEIIKKLIQAFNIIKSPFIAQTESIKFSLTFLKNLTIKAISPFIFFPPNKTTTQVLNSSKPTEKKNIIKLEESQQTTFLENKKASEMKKLVDSLFGSELYSSFFDAETDNKKENENENESNENEENKKLNEKCFDDATLFLLSLLNVKDEINASVSKPPSIQQNQNLNQKNQNGDEKKDFSQQLSVAFRIGNNLYALNAIPSVYFSNLPTSTFPIEMKMKDIFKISSKKQESKEQNNNNINDKNESSNKDENQNGDLNEPSYIIVDNFVVSKNARIADIWLKIWVPIHGISQLHLTAISKIPEDTGIDLIEDSGLVEFPGDLD